MMTVTEIELTLIRETGRIPTDLAIPMGDSACVVCGKGAHGNLTARPNIGTNLREHHRHCSKG